MKNYRACFLTMRVISWGESSKLLMKMEIYSVNQQYFSLNSYKIYSVSLCEKAQIKKKSIKIHGLSRSKEEQGRSIGCDVSQSVALTRTEGKLIRYGRSLRAAVLRMSLLEARCQKRALVPVSLTPLKWAALTKGCVTTWLKLREIRGHLAGQLGWPPPRKSPPFLP